MHTPQVLLALVLLILGGFYAWVGIYISHRQIKARASFVGMMLSMSLWSLFYGLEIMANTLSAKLLWARIEYLGIVSLPVLWLIFVLTFIGHSDLLTKRFHRALWIIPLLTLGMVWTNDLHHSIWSAYWIDETSPFFLAVYQHGWYFWIHTIYSYGLILAGTVILGVSSLQLVGIYRLQFLSMFFGILVAISGNLLYLSGLLSIPGLDVTPITFFPTTLSILWAIRRYRLLEVAPLSFGQIVETFWEAVIVLDEHQRVLYMNPAAEALIGKTYESVVGKPFYEVCQFAQSLRNDLSGVVERQVEIALEKEGQEIVMEIALHPIELIHRGQKGTLLVLRNVTEVRLAQRAKERWTAILQTLSVTAVELMRASAWEDVTPAVLEALGRAADVSRVYLFQNLIEHPNTLIFSQRFEWAAPHASPQIDNPELKEFRPMEQGFERWVGLLSENKVINGPIRTFPPAERPILEAQEIRSILVVPIFVEGRWWGFLGFDECRSERKWETNEIQALRLSAELFSAAIQRQTMQSEMEQHQQTLDVMQEIIMLALQSYTLESMGQTLVDHLGMLTGAEHAFFTLWDEEQQRVVPLAAYGKYRDVYSRMAPKAGGQTLTAAALERGGTLIVEDTLNTPYLDPQIARQFETRCMLVLPLIADGQRLGALLLGYSHPHTFTAQEIAIGERTAALVALVLLKFKAVARAERRAQEADTLRHAGAAIVSTLQLNEVIERILDELQKVIPYDSASVQLLKDGELEIVGGRGWEDARQVLGIRFPLDGSNPNTVVIQTLEPLLLKDTSSYPTFQKPPHHRIRSWLGVPLLAHGRAIGLLAIDSYHENFFTQEHVNLLTAFANQVAMALENARLYEETQMQALTDPLTGLYNRRGLIELGKIELGRVLRQQKPFSCVMLDIDHFKRVNDTYGHLVGDQVLHVLARRCEKATRELDLIGRYGGEEFLILLPEADWHAALNIANRLRILVAEAAIPTRVGPLRVTISLGVSQYTATDGGLEALIERADRALYQAKERGRNQAVAFEEMRQT